MIYHLQARRGNNLYLFIFATMFLLVLCVCSCSVKKQGIQSKELVNQADTSNIDTEDGADDYFINQFLRYEDYVYKEKIKTVQLHKEGWPLAEPIIELNTNEKIKLSFDDFDNGIGDYSYTIIHCNSKWEDSELIPTDFINGFFENEILDYSHSFNTIQSYIHYNLIIPNEDLGIKISGNYILKVFEEGKPDVPILTKRFMVVESKVTVIPSVRKATLISDNNYKQEVDFVINHEGYSVMNPYGDLYVVIRQNGRWDNAISGLNPVFVRDNELIYDYDEDNVFNGGNEFRNFNFKSFRFQTEFIEKYEFDSLGNNVHLYRDKLRYFLRYTSHSDINGRFFIKNDEGDNSEVDADYAYVHFTLPYEAPMINGSIYILGGLTNWGFGLGSRMKYNYKKFAYENVLYLKQGYYEYEYVYLEDGKKIGEAPLIEGSHYDTENEYSIFVYNTSPSQNYNSLIAVKKFSSRY